MFKNIIRQVPIYDILVDRPARQRSSLTYESVISLAISIGRSQWINPILIDEETNYLVAGERRLTAVKILNKAMNGDYSGFIDPAAAQQELTPICTCKVESWGNWEKIPAQFGKDFTPSDLLMYEFIENAQRQDLSWQDRAKAIYNIHTRSLLETKDWTAVDTARIIGIHKATVAENIRVWRSYADEDASLELKAIIEEAQTLRSAAQFIERYTSRRNSGIEVSLVSGGAAVPKPKAEVSIYNKPGPTIGTNVYDKKVSYVDYDENIEETLADKILINADFVAWASSYDGEPFNFIHCDFPYGINFNTGKYTSQPIDMMIGGYDDSPETYWKLLNCLKDNSQLIAQQAHIMFWFSQNLRRETEDFFASLGGFVQPFLMIWHQSPNEGIVPDPQRYGRRTYETAMLITFGDRKIVVPQSLSIESTRGTQTRIHRSQKPGKVLRNFFEMFVDNSSTVLDPTAGSGMSLIVASELNAKRVVGLEIDPVAYRNAYNHINAASAIKL